MTLVQDEEEPVNWYFFKDKNHGFELRTGYDKKGCLFNHATMVKTFLEAIGRDTGISHNFILAGTPTIMKGDKTQYWGVLVV